MSVLQQIQLPLRHSLSNGNHDFGWRLGISMNTALPQNRQQWKAFYVPYPQTHRRSREDPTDYLK